MRPFAPGRPFAAVLALAVVLATSPSSHAAGATLLGRVTNGPEASPRAGVVVALYDPTTQATFRSEPTDARGAFRIGSAAAGTYRVVVESTEGAYLAGNAVALKAGDNPPLAVALRPNAQEPPSPTPPAPTPPEPAPTTPPPSAGSQQAPWVKWVIAGGIILGGALVVDAVTDDEEEASAFGQPAK